MPLIPGRRGAPVDVVPVDYVADAIVTLSSRGDSAGRTYSLAAGAQASSVGELMRLSAQAFGRTRPLTVPPALYERTVHPLLLRRSRGAKRRWLEQAPVFFPYFALRVRYDTSRAQEALAAAGLGPPSLATYFERLVAFAEAARWGRRRLSRIDAAGAQSRTALAAPSGRAARQPAEVLRTG